MANAETLAERLRDRLATTRAEVQVALGEVTMIVGRDELLNTCRRLRDEDGLRFEQLIDLCAVDYSEYGESTWSLPRFAVVYHLLSLAENHRVRLKVFVEDGPMPKIPSVGDIWSSAGWYEREAFDLFGIVFEGHPDLRRLLTDYGFIGYPFRKDFPLIGTVEMRYDPEKRRVVYEPVSIEPRTLVPRVIRHDNRYVVPTLPGAKAKQQEEGG